MICLLKIYVQRITAQAKSSASASSFVPSTMPPLAIATAEERKKQIKLGIRRQPSAGSASGPTSPGWSPGKRLLVGGRGEISER